MCTKCEQLKAAAAAGRKNRPVVGIVSQQLLADFNAHALAKGNAELDVDQLVLNGKRAWLNDEIEEGEAKARQAIIDNALKANKEKYDAAHTALWDRTYDELGLVGLDRGLGYGIDHKTGEVRRSADKNPLGFLGDLIAGAAEVHIIHD